MMRAPIRALRASLSMRPSRLQIDEVSVGTAHTIMTEMGTDRWALPREAYLATWLGLATLRSVAGCRLLPAKRLGGGLRGAEIAILRRAAQAATLICRLLHRREDFAGDGVASCSGCLHRHTSAHIPRTAKAVCYNRIAMFLPVSTPRTDTAVSTYGA